MATRRPTRRPARTIRLNAYESVPGGGARLLVDEHGNPVLEDYVQQVGRRAGLHEGKSQTSYRRRLVNRRDRHAARAQLRRDPNAVELRQPRGRAVSLAS
jgi:hypothetical protein